jgi:hypothetical protein
MSSDIRDIYYNQKQMIKKTRQIEDSLKNEMESFIDLTWLLFNKPNDWEKIVKTLKRCQECDIDYELFIKLFNEQIQKWEESEESLYG